MGNLYNREFHHAAHRVIDIIMEYTTQDKRAEYDHTQRHLHDLRWDGVILKDYHFKESIFHSRRNEGLVITIHGTNAPENIKFGVPQDLITPWGIWRPLHVGGSWGASYASWEKVFPELMQRLKLEPAFVKKPISNIVFPEHPYYAVRSVDGYNIPPACDLGFCSDDEAKEISVIWDKLQAKYLDRKYYGI